MRQKLAFLAVVCLITLPLAAASNAPAQDQAAVPAQAVTAQQEVVQDVVPVAPAAVNPLPLGGNPFTTAALGDCTTASDCTQYCISKYNTPYGSCVNFHCWCLF